jgi:hypothetical protein
VGKLILVDENLSIKQKTSLFKSEILPGDILFFHTQSNDTIPKVDNRYPGHEGINIGNNNLIHANTRIGKVIISNINDDDYMKKLVGYKNVVDYLDYDDLINNLENKIKILRSSKKGM